MAREYWWEKIAKTKKHYSGQPQLLGRGRMYTGRGADGVLQADKPAMINMNNGQPTVIHEGEIVNDTPNGTEVIPAKMVSLNSPKEQEIARELEQKMNLNGMQTGGIIPKASINTLGAPPSIGTLRGRTGPTAAIPTAPNSTTPQASTLNPLSAPTGQSGVRTAPKASPLGGTSIKDPIGLNTLKGIASGETDLYKDNFTKANNQQLGRLGAAQAFEKAASAQQMAQSGASDAVKNVLNANQERSQSLERGAVTQSLASQQMGQQTKAQEGAIREVIQGKKEAIENLIKLGGQENMDKAEEYAKEVYGSDVYGLGDIRNDQKMSAIAKYTAIPGMSVDGAMDLLKQNGDLERYGITPEEARKFASALVLGSDPIYQAKSHYGDMLDDGLISPEEYSDAVDFVKWSQLNPEGVEIVDSYRVTDAEGKEVGNFKTQSEADLFMKNNNGNFSTELVPNGYIGYKDEYDEYFGDYLQGDIFTGTDGNLYTVNDGQKVIARPTPEDPFSQQNVKLLRYLESNGMENDTTREIRRQQVNAMEVDPSSVPVGMLPSSQVYKDMLSKATSLEDPTGAHKAREQGHGHSSEVVISSLHNLADDTWVDLDGKLYLYKGKEKQVIDNDDDVNSYEFYNPTTGEKFYYKTTRDKKGVYREDTRGIDGHEVRVKD